MPWLSIVAKRQVRALLITSQFALHVKGVYHHDRLMSLPII